MNGTIQPALPQGSAIVVDSDGVYRWVYELDLYKNPTILLTVAKILGAIVGIGLALLVGMSVRDYLTSDHIEALRREQLIDNLLPAVLFALFFAALVVVGYYIYAIMQGGRYCVLFTMDETRVTHKQLPRGFEKARAVSALNVLAGLTAGSPSQVGLGVLVATRDTMSSDFANVRSVKGSRTLQVIKVNEPLAKNQVYVEAQDYDFVLAHIAQHCPKAKVSG